MTCEIHGEEMVNGVEDVDVNRYAAMKESY